MNKYVINRKLYKDVKKYDHNQMNDFLTKVYKNGFIDGINKATEGMAEERMKDIKRAQINTEELEKQILSIKGIGAVKAAEVMKIITGGGGDD